MKKNAVPVQKTFRCPACQKLQIRDNTNSCGFDKTIRESDATIAEILSPKPGQLTECDHCKARLEYDESLALQIASPARIKAFIRLAGLRDLTEGLPDLIEYVGEYWSTDNGFAPYRES